VRDRLQRVERNERADVVHHEAPHRAPRPRREQHADEAPHRSADPADPADPEAREQRLDVGEELAEVVLERSGEPIALAAAGEVDADDARIAAELAREEVEIARVAAIAVRADDDVRVPAIAPFGVVQPVEAADAERGEGLVAWPDARDRARRTRFESGFERAAAAPGVHDALQRRGSGADAVDGGEHESRDHVADRDAALEARAPDVLMDRLIGRVFTLVIHLQPPCGRFSRSTHPRKGLIANRWSQYSVYGAVQQTICFRPTIEKS